MGSLILMILSTTAGLAETRMSLHQPLSVHGLHHVVVFSDSRCTLKMLVIDAYSSSFVWEVADARRALQDAVGSVSPMVPCPSDVPGNYRANSLAAAAYLDEERTMFYRSYRRDKIDVTPCDIFSTSEHRCLWGNTTCLSRGLGRSSRALLHCLRANCAFPRAVLYHLGRVNAPNCVLCGDFGGFQHVLCLSPILGPLEIQC